LETDRLETVSPSALAAGVEAVAIQLDAPMAASRISSALIGCRGDSWAERLKDALWQLELESWIELLEAKAAIDAARESEVMVTRDGREWLMLSGNKGTRHARAIWVSEQGRQRAAWVDADDLRDSLGERACWLHVHRGMPMRQLSGVAKGMPSPVRAVAQVKRLFVMERELVRAIVAYAVLVGMLELLTPIAVQALVNTIAFNVVLQPLIVLSVALLVALCFLGTLRVAEHWVVELFQRRLFIRLVTDLAERLPRVTLATHQKKDIPELVNRFFDIVTVQKSAAKLLLDTLSISLQLILGTLLLALYHPYLLTFALLLSFGVFVVVFMMGRGAVNTSLEESDAKYKVAAWLEEVSSDPTRFSSRRGEQAAAHRAETLALGWLARRTAHFRILMRQIVGAAVLHALASAGLLVTGGYLVINQQLTLGQLVAAELIVTAVAASVAKLGKHLETFYDLTASVYKVGKLLDLELEPSAGEVLERDIPELHARLVSPRGSELVMKARSSVAITGSDPEAASRLLDILYAMRPGGGWTGYINDLDIAGLSGPALRERIEMVRDAQAFDGTVEENVTLEIPLDGVIRARGALEAVGLLDELNKDADGLATKLTGTGSPLNQEQLGRMAIARALASSPDILLVDRALDYVTASKQELVLDAVFGTNKATLVVVTEHPDVIARCERVVTLKDGEFVLVRDKNNKRGTDGEG
jgi:ABC-type bacteriocin/lantibiotic exporter with double-glycine peptidase domain